MSLGRFFGIGILVSALSLCGSLAQAQAPASKKPQMGLSVKDRLDIMDLYTRYAWDMDNGLGDDMAANVFAPDAEIHEPSYCAVGSADVNKYARLYARGDHFGTHMAYNILIEGSGNKAYGRAYILNYAENLPYPPGTKPTIALQNGPAGLEANLSAVGAGANPTTGAATASSPEGATDNLYFGPNVRTRFMGSYNDTFTKIKGRWYFKTRQIWVQKPIQHFDKCTDDLAGDSVIPLGGPMPPELEPPAVPNPN